MTAILDQLAERAQARKADVTAAWWKLVKHVSNGDGDLDPEEVEQILVDAGKTGDHLQAAVALCQHRKALLQQADRVSHFGEEYRRIGTTIEKAGQEIDEALRAHQHKLLVLQAQQADTAKKEQEAIAAKSELVKTCPYIDRVEEYKSKQWHANHARSEAARLRRQVEDLERAATANEQRRNQDVADRQRARAATLISQVQTMEQTAAALDGEATKLSAVLMEP